jgi:sarcosine oxidase subunit alpha
VINDGVVARTAENDYLLTCTSTGSQAIYEYLQWWLQSGWGPEVSLTNITEDYGAVNLAGPHARNVLRQLTDDPIDNNDFPYLHARRLTIAGIPCRAMRRGFVGELSYEIHCPASHTSNLWQALLQAGKEYGISPFGVEAQRVLRLEKAHIIVGQDTDATSDPLSAGAAWAVKLDKKDFLGHRALSRISEEGSGQKLVGFKMKDGKTVPSEGEQVIARAGGRYHAVGWVTSARLSPTLNEPVGLAWVPVEYNDSFIIRVNKNPVEALVHRGPFYDPEGKKLTC